MAKETPDVGPIPGTEPIASGTRAFFEQTRNVLLIAYLPFPNEGLLNKEKERPPQARMYDSLIEGAYVSS
jgi:hypothetical protein